MTPAEVKQAMLKKLKDSALTETDARKLGFVPLTAEQLKKKYPDLTKFPLSGFVLPYYTIEGQPTSFFRFRFLEEPVRSGFDRLIEHKAIRYVQPAGEAPRVYFPPGQKLIGQQRLYITEGELKAACAAKFGIPTIGLGGVWNFRTKDGIMIPDLDGIPWDKIEAMIVYDSDAVQNHLVLMAENVLAREILRRSGHVNVIRLPQLEPGVKTGLDDFLVAEGLEAFNELEQEPFQESEALHQLNEEVVLIDNPGTLMRWSDGFKMDPHGFVHTHYADRNYKQTIAGPNNSTRVIDKCAPKEWMKWPGRAKLERFTYKPGEDKIVKGELNIWKGWGVDKELIKPGPVVLWTQLLDYIFRDTKPEHRRWFEQWLAYPLQHPGAKLFTACVLWGRIQGTGKTLIGHTMKRIYGPNYQEISNRELNSSFNEWSEGKQFVMGDEITGGDRYGVADRLKSMITGQTIYVNVKFEKPYNVPDTINYLFTSNHPDSFIVEDADRRYFIHEIKSAPLPKTFYTQQYDPWYKSDSIGHLFHYLLHLPLEGFHPFAHAPETDAKREMVELNRNEAAVWVATLRDEPETALKVGDKSIEFSLCTTRELYGMFNPENKRITEIQLGKELKRAGFERFTVYTRVAGTQKLWAVRDRERLVKCSPKAIIDLYDKERAGTKKGAKY